MTSQHPITPPSEPVRQWLEELYGGPVSVISSFDQRVLASHPFLRFCPAKMTDLSPAEQAVLDAVEDDCIHPTDLHRIAAAALRAAADQVVPENQFGPPENAAAVQREITRRSILAIADELKTFTTENR